MVIPDECWAYIFTFLYIKDFQWPVHVPKPLRKNTCFKVRLQRAKPLHSFKHLYQKCAVEGCLARRGAFKDLIVSPYCVPHACQWHCPRIIYLKEVFVIHNL